jgi:hypothetical protein
MHIYIYLSIGLDRVANVEKLNIHLCMFELESNTYTYIDIY